jgi:hypothetical protein
MAYPWGKPKQVALEELWVVVTYLYHGLPAWKQVPMTLDLDATIPKDFVSEVGAVTQEVMKTLGRELNQEAYRQQIEFFLTSNTVHRMAREGAISQEAVSGKEAPWHLEAQVLEELAERMKPRVAQGIIDGIRQSLAIQFETLPFNVKAPKHRDEKMMMVQETRPDPNRRPTPFSGQPMIARTILGRAIWEPTVVPFVLPKAWIGNLLEARTHLSFSMVDLKWDPAGICQLSPYPWGRYDLTNPGVDPVVTFPLSEIGCPPDPAKVLAAAGCYPEGSPAQDVLKIIGTFPNNQPWFSMADYLDWEPPPPGNTGTGGGNG